MLNIFILQQINNLHTKIFFIFFVFSLLYIKFKTTQIKRQKQKHNKSINNIIIMPKIENFGLFASYFRHLHQSETNINTIKQKAQKISKKNKNFYLCNLLIISILKIILKKVVKKFGNL